LRDESATEALWVGQTLSAHGITHHTLKWDHGDDLNRLHERARTARYELLLDFCQQHADSALLTAHHQQDQVETILMRFLKGTGPAGFQGIQDVRCQNDVPIVRPLLQFTPEELRGYLIAKGVAWVEDPSNHNEFYERTRIRALVKHLSAGWEQGGILKSAAKVYGLQQNFAELTADYANGFVITNEPLTVDQLAFFECPEAVQHHWLRQQIWQIGGANYPKPMATITVILKMLQQPHVNGYQVAGCVIHVDKGQILLREFR
jgi:tRNA(Ile)-lysidine synthase